MDGEALFEAAAARAGELPAMSVGIPFGPEWDV